jgi:hypothetical protein
MSGHGGPVLSERLKQWDRVTHEQHEQAPRQDDPIQRHIIYNLLLFRLDRPSPGNPVPDRHMRQQSIQAALDMVNAYVRYSRDGLFFYIWHAAQHLFELGVFLLQFRPRRNAGVHPGQILQGGTVGRQDRLRRVRSTVFSIFGKIAKRWPETTVTIRSLEDVSRPILEDFRGWKQRNGWHEGLLDSAVNQRLASMARMPKLPTQQTFDDNTPDLPITMVSAPYGTGMRDAVVQAEPRRSISHVGAMLDLDAMDSWVATNPPGQLLEIPNP